MCPALPAANGLGFYGRARGACCRRRGNYPLHNINIAKFKLRLPPDARSLARHHLRSIDGRIEKLLANKDRVGDDYTLAHLEELNHQIGKTLNADVQANDP